MLHTNIRPLLKPELSGFCGLVVHHALVLLLLTHTCGGRSQVIGASQPIVTTVGGDVILSCHLEPATNAANLTVEWARPDLQPRFVHLRRDGLNLLTVQHPSYASRTSLSISKLRCGDISLKLSRVKLSDAGTYICHCPSAAKDFGVKLVVGSATSPAINISKFGSRVVLGCESGGWYPEPEVLWLDSEGKLLPAGPGPAETVRGADDLYTVSSRVTVEKRRSSSYTCRVRQRDTNHTRDAHIRVSDDFFMNPSSSSARITIILVVCFMCALIVIVLFVWKAKKTNTRQDEAVLGNTKTTFSNSVEPQYLQRAKDKLEQLQKNDEELKNVKEVIDTLTRQKKIVKNQRDKLNSLLQEVTTKIEENSKKNTILNKDKRLKKSKDLERTKSDVEKLLKNTEKLLETTEGMILTMTEKKGKLKNNKEHMIKQREETERVEDELQSKLLLEKSEGEEQKHEPVTNDLL